MPKAQTTATLETPSGPSCVNKDQARGWRSDGVKVDATRKITLYQRSESPQEAISAIGWFSASILHDLRNPLATICAGAELLMDLDSPSTQVKRLAAKMCHAAGQMRQLLADLPSVTRNNVSSAEVCDIREVIAAASEAALAAKEYQCSDLVRRACWDRFAAGALSH